MQTMMYFHFNGLPLPVGSAVVIYWDGFPRAYTHFTTGSNGEIELQDNLFEGKLRKTRYIYVYPIRNGHPYILDNETLYRNRGMAHTIDTWRRD